jgi:DNA-binding NarL/FixJ family response regulator
MDTLTKREMEVALLVVEGLRNREIAEKLCIAEKTMENHLTMIYAKLHVKSRTQLICLLMQDKKLKHDDRINSPDDSKFFAYSEGGQT